MSILKHRNLFDYILLIDKYMVDIVCNYYLCRKFSYIW